MASINGQVAIVTGAGRGLGRGYARRLAGLGATMFEAGPIMIGFDHVANGDFVTWAMASLRTGLGGCSSLPERADWPSGSTGKRWDWHLPGPRPRRASRRSAPLRNWSGSGRDGSHGGPRIRCH